MNQRMDKLLSAAHLTAEEGILIHKPSNMFYLSGYTGEGLIAAGCGFQAIITDFRYTEQAERQAPGFQVLMRHSRGAGRQTVRGARRPPRPV